MTGDREELYRRNTPRGPKRRAPAHPKVGPAAHSKAGTSAGKGGVDPT